METLEVRGLIQDAPLRMIAARIKKARKESGLSHDKVAERAGTSRQHLISLEKGLHRPRPEMMERLAAALEKPLDFFLVPEAGNPGPFPDEAA